MKLLIIWAIISIVACVETIVMKISISRHFKQKYGRPYKHKPELRDYIISFIGCLIPLYHVYLICAYTFAGDSIEARTTFMMLIAEALDDDDNNGGIV